jgi:hypothetical protein
MLCGLLNGNFYDTWEQRNNFVNGSHVKSIRMYYHYSCFVPFFCMTCNLILDVMFYQIEFCEI